jgi:alpha-L-arabinofuranosidase
VYDTIRCYVADTLIHEAIFSPLPSLVALATYDTENKLVLLKVVNTTSHAEKTALHIQGAAVKHQAQVIQLTGLPEAENTSDHPIRIAPMEEEIFFPLGSEMEYSFPPHSISIMQLQVN